MYFQRKVKQMTQLEQFISIEQIDKMIKQIVEDSDSYLEPITNNEWKVKGYIDIEKLLDIIEKFTGRKINNEKNN